MRTTTTIDLLRHGETIGGSRFRGSIDEPLTEQGWTQMWAAIEKHTDGWDDIISSPLTRCAAFANALCRRTAAPLTCDDRIKEMHFGDWEGRSADELLATAGDALTRFWENPLRHTPPAAEPLSTFAARVLSAWGEIETNYSGRKILLVTHGGVIRVILCHILRHPIERLLEHEIGHATMRRICIEHARGQHRTASIARYP